MAMLCQDYDRVALLLGPTSRKEVLFSIDVALWAAARLEEFAQRTLLCPPRGLLGLRDREPSIDVEAVLNENKPQVRWRFAWSSSRLTFTAPQAVELAKLTRLMASTAKKQMKWEELSQPLAFVR